MKINRRWCFNRDIDACEVCDRASSIYMRLFTVEKKKQIFQHTLLDTKSSYRCETAGAPKT